MAVMEAEGSLALTAPPPLARQQTPQRLKGQMTRDEVARVPLLAGKEALNDRANFWPYPLSLAGAGYNEVVPVHGTDEMDWRATPRSVVRECDWKLIQIFEDDSVQLHNLKNDRGERKGLAARPPDRATAMLKKLQAWQKETKAPIPSVSNPDFEMAAANGRGGKK